MSYPKVLVISPVKFNQETGSGVTMSNLFKGWPLQKIAQIHSENYTTADLSVCNTYYDLPYYQIRKSNRITTFVEFSRQLFMYLQKGQVSLAGQWLHTKNLLEWCHHLNPDLIYARPHPRPSFYIWLPLFLSKQLSIPFVTRVLDDWPARLEVDSPLPRKIYWRLVLHRQVRQLFQKSAANIGISEEMGAAFEQRYGAPFLSFHNCIDIAEWERVEKDYRAKIPFKILYLGTVTQEKELSSLVDIRNAVLKLHEMGYKIQWTIYGPKIYQETIETNLTAPPVITFGGYFPIEMKQAILSDADLLLLPINFDSISQRYVGYSFQTKVPEYLASGTPTLVYGPPANPNVRYASTQGWGVVVNQEDEILLVKALLQLMEDEDLRQTLGQKSRALAFSRHNAETVRQSFQDLIRQAADQGSSGKKVIA